MLSEEDLQVRALANRFVREEVAPHAAAWEIARYAPDVVVRRMGEIGLLGLVIPQEYGGSGAGVRSFCIAMEEVAAGDGGLSTIFHVHSMGVARMIAKHGTEDQKRRWLPAMATGEVMAAFCLTEPQAGSDTAAIRSKAEPADGGWRLSGTKQFITNGARAGLAVVVAVTDPSAGKRGISAFLVPTKTPGFVVSRIEDKLGQASSDTAQMILDDVLVPDEALLGTLDRALPMALETLAEGRISVAAQAVGFARAALDLAIAYARDRQAFAKPLIEHQAVAFRLADMATNVEVTRAFVHDVAGRIDLGESCLKEASMAKLYSGKMAEEVCSAAIDVFGGNGYLKDYGVERIYRDVRVCQIYEGTNDVQRMIIARQLQR